MEKQNGFAWDADKAAFNVAKHRGISFKMGRRVFDDPKMVFVFSRMEKGEARHLAIGAIVIGDGQEFLLTVVCSLRDWPGDDYSTTHIISVRPATNKERRLYE